MAQLLYRLGKLTYLNRWKTLVVWLLLIAGMAAAAGRGTEGAAWWATVLARAGEATFAAAVGAATAGCSRGAVLGAGTLV